MPHPALPPECMGLLPNALLVLAAIDALNPLDRTRSPVTDEVGWALGENASWVRRHGVAVNTGCGRGDLALANLSANGSCTLGMHGRMVADALRRVDPATPPPVSCRHCGAPASGGVNGARQLYACGSVQQFCPDHIPGSPRAEVPPRSRRAQREGGWFRARHCGEALPCYWAKWRNSPFRRAVADVQPSRSVDGTELLPGTPVCASRDSPAFGSHGATVGIVVEAANSTVLVSWPAVPGVPGSPWARIEAGFPEMDCDLVDACHLVVAGAPDRSGLSDYQMRLCRALEAREVVLATEPGTGRWDGTFEGRRIVPRALEVLAEHRLLPVPVPPAATVAQA